MKTTYSLAEAFSEFPMIVRYTVLPHGKDLPPPAYQSEHAAGLDLRAAVDKNHGMSILPHEWAVVPTGLCLSIPKGFEGQVRPRSGLAMNYAVTVLNSPGTIDADYRGEINVILINHNPDFTFKIERGLRIAQIVFAPVQTITLQLAVDLDETNRGEGGFGSTG